MYPLITGLLRAKGNEYFDLCGLITAVNQESENNNDSASLT